MKEVRREIMVIEDGMDLGVLLKAIDAINDECNAAPYPGKRIKEVFFEMRRNWGTEQHETVAICSIIDKDYE